VQVYFQKLHFLLTRPYSQWGFLLLFSVVVSASYAQTTSKPAAKDTTRNSRDARRKLYARWNDRLGNRYTNKPPRSPFFLKDPKNVSNEFKIDTTRKMSVYEKLGDPKTTKLNFRNPATMTYEQFQQLQDDRVMNSLMHDYSAKQDGKGALGGRGLLPKLELPPIFDRIFGGNVVDIKPNGSVGLDMAIVHARNENPSIAIGQRTQTYLDVKQQININFAGKIGDKLNINTNFDTQASFNFENQLKLNYKAEEHSLVQDVQLGNLKWQLPTQLITGVQNLFGLKTDLKFGRLMTTFVVSNQRSKQQCITLRGGLQNRPFEIKSDAYDENRNFFLAQFFRDNYERSLKYLPQITSGVTVTRVEAYVTNRTNNTETLRNVVGFADLGEAKPYSQEAVMQPIRPNRPVDNTTNGLFRAISNDKDVRAVDRTTFAIESKGIRRGEDYDILRGARRLRDTEFRFHPDLGYVSLLTPLRNDEVLAVSYEYRTKDGQRHQVGELIEDYQARPADEVLVLKLLKSVTIRNNTANPMWNLMMKNVYSLNTTQIAKQGFQLRIVYKDDLTGLDNPNLQEGRNLQNIPLLRVMNLDRLNSLGDPQPDGNFDFIEGTTIDSRFGKIIFPVLEPFGSSLAKKFESDEDNLKSKYVFSDLYRGTLIDAQQITEKNKFFLKGSYQGSAGGASVQLPFGVSEQSVTVKAAGAQLQAGTDFVLEAQIGQLRIINESVMNSGRDIEVCYEQPDLFQNQIRRMLGTRLEYTVNPNFKIGATGMSLRETPAGFISRTAIGNEPIDNSMIGVDIKYRSDSRWLTRMVDALPFLQTKEPSSVQFEAEFAQSFAGISPQAKGRSFVDDFESAKIAYDLTRQPNRWKLGATPPKFSQGSVTDPLESGYNRAKISAYSVDNTLTSPGGFGGVSRPKGITDSDLENYYEKYYLPQDLYPGRSQSLVQLPEAILDIAFFPEERGMYNYTTDLTTEGRLKNPRKNFGAITRAVASDPDFDNANIENISFWLMDPFITGENGVIKDGRANPTPNTTGGKLHINLGEVSEDIMKNGRYDFENGLPIDSVSVGKNVTESKWGYTTKQQFLVNTFSNQAGTRAKQDVGLDGLSNSQERVFFKDYLQKLPTNLTPKAKADIVADPSGDDFEFYFSDKADAANQKIVERYKHYMGMENNSPEITNGSQLLVEASSTIPDAEDLNIDNTINDQEQFFEYDINLQPGQIEVGKGYVVDRVNARGANWYLFRIPIREFTRKYGGINGFKNIRFMRMYMDDWQQPVVLRMSQLQMVSTQYRKYNGDLNARGLQEIPEPYDAQFSIATVSAEENSAQSADPKAPKYVYGSPPGFDRDVDFTTTNQMQLNEQAMSLCVSNLRDGDSRAAFKNVNLNLIQRKRLKMFIHLQNQENESGQASAFLRLGTDITENYYDIELKGLKVTNPNEADRRAIWPLENELDIAFSDLINVKSLRDQQLSRSLTTPFTKTITTDLGRTYNITVVGHPDLSAIMMLMIGVRNPRSGDQQPKSFCIWVDELHTDGIDKSSGSAGLVTANIKLADFATVQASGRFSTFGFGSIQQKIADRNRDYNREYSISATIGLDKLFPQKWGLRIPLYVNLDNKKNTPHYNPLDPDMPLETAISNFSENDPRRDKLRNIAEESAVRKGFNFSNVRKVKVNPASKKHFFDIENFSATYAYNEYTRQNSMIADYSQRQYKGGLAYQYSFPQKVWEPFKNVKSLDRPYLELLKNFNLSLMPTQVAVRVEADRSFTRTVFRAADLTADGQSPMFEKYFLIKRSYDAAWNLTKNLNMTYKATANAVLDEPFGDINTEAKSDSIWRSIKRLGRTKNFNQDIRITYRLPLDQIPLLDWMTGDYSHTIGYQYQANSLGLKDSLGIPFGNTIRNNREYSLIGRVDFVKLYNKIRYLNFANRPSQARKKFARIPGDDEDIVPEPSRIAKNITRFLMAVRGIDVTYIVSETSTLPGFLPDDPRSFGLDAIRAPGLPFILGAQDPNFARRAASNGWFSKSAELNQPFVQTLNKTFKASTRVQPFKDFNIRIEAQYTRGDDFREFYRPSLDGVFQSNQFNSGVRNGNFQMSFVSFKTAFAKINDDNTSPVYDTFKRYREIVQEQLMATKRGSGEYTGGEYALNSQDVLIPAFVAAYNGKTEEELRTGFKETPDKMVNPFLRFPLPNWHIDYGGLAQLKPFNKIFSSFTIEHGYQSTYSVGNFTSALSYEALYVNMAVRNYPTALFTNSENQFIPVFAMSTITLSEKFNPLIGIRAVTKSRINFSLKYNRDRTVTVNLANAQLAEIYNKDISATLGFTKNNMRIPFKINGKYQKLKNDLKMECNFILRDNRIIERRFDEPPTPTYGAITVTFNPTIDYTVSKLWSITLYYTHTSNTPFTSNNFYRLDTRGGVRVRFNIAEL
jgi:cell surface protein SprA